MLNKRADVLVPGIKQRLYHFAHKRKDRITVWNRPRRAKDMSVEDYQRYPKSIQIREFKVGGVIYMTTLLERKTYSKRALWQLYQRRWEIETHLNSIKTTMQMDTLSCKKPAMIRKEIGIHFLAYNIIRELMTQACLHKSRLPSHVSFKGTIQLLKEFLPFLLYSPQKKNTLYTTLLRLITTKKVGDRTGRVEPRLLKPRRQKFPNLKQTRAAEQQELRLRAQERSNRITIDLLEA